MATERATRVHTEGMLRDAEATIRDLREKLATANQTIHTMGAELAAERLARPKPDDATRPAMAIHETVVATVRDAAVSIIRRPVGRPRKIVAVVESAEAPIWPMAQPQLIREDAASAVRRPVGRPRKITVVQPLEKPIRPTKKPQPTAKAVTKKSNQQTDDQEPVQWWVEGWKGR